MTGEPWAGQGIGAMTRVRTVARMSAATSGAESEIVPLTQPRMSLRSWRASAAKLAAVPAGASPADIGGPVDVVVISSGGKGNRSVGSLDVKASGGWGSAPGQIRTGRRAT